MSDGVDFPLVIHSFCQPVLESQWEVSSTFPKNLMTYNVSQFMGLALGKFSSCFFNKLIKFSSFTIFADFLIPYLFFKLKEPVSKL